MHRVGGGLCDAVVTRVFVCAMATGAIVGCGGADSSSGVGPDGQVHQGIGVSGTLTVSPTSVTLVQGQSATVTLTLSLKGKSPGTITFGVSPMAGVSASFNPLSLTGSGSTTVTLTAASNANIVAGATPYFAGFVGADTLLLDGLAPTINLTVRNARPSVSVQKAGSGSGTVTSSPAGINCGATCSAIFDLGAITLTATPAAGSAFTSWSGVCVGTALTCTFTPNDFGNVITATFTSTAPAMALAVSPLPLSVQAGASVTGTVTITRVNGYADPVNLAVTAPSGLTVSANPTSVPGTTSALTIAAAPGLAAGNYPVTITATGNGVTQQVVTFPVQVPVSANGGAIAFNYASCDASRIPVWFGVQNGTGGWTRVTPSNNTFSFTIGATGAYAVMTRSGADTVTSVLYASAAEIGEIAAATPCGTDPPTGTKRIFGAFANAGSAASNVFPTVMIGGSQFTKTNDSTASFTLTEVPSGPRDLIAARIQSAANVSRMILRRNTNYSNNQNIGLVDFGSAESFNPPLAVLTPLNLGGDQISVEASLLTANGLSAPYFSSNFLGAAGNTAYAAVPDTLLRQGDFHQVSILASPGGGTAFRFVNLLTHSPNTSAPTQLSFGPRVSGAAVTPLATTPYLRLRGQIASQSSYGAGASADFVEGGRTVTISMTTGYLGSAPATWTLDVPDLSAAGYDPAWALKSGQSTDWDVVAVGGNVLPFIGGNAVDNAQITGAGVQSEGASFSRSSLPRMLRQPRYRPTSQMFNANRSR